MFKLYPVKTDDVKVKTEIIWNEYKKVIFLRIKLCYGIILFLN